MQLQLNAHAKINLTLDVVGKCADGYHELESVMQTLSVYDTLTVTVTQTGGENEINIICDRQEELCREEENICFRACAAFLKEFGINGQKIDIEIVKRIPIAAGLGGGSSDGAATIKALDILFATNAGDDRLQRLAATIGADVPFFIRGGTQLAKGIGDVLEPLQTPKIGYVVLAKPAMSLLSGNVYALFDSLDPEGSGNPMTQAFLCAADSEKAKYTNNMLTRAVTSLKGTGAIEALEKKMLDYGAVCAHMSGSGPTVYGIFTDYARAVVAASLIKQEMTDIKYCDVCDMYNTK